MTQAEIYAGLTEIFRDIFMRDDLVLKPETTAQDVEGWDSMRMIEIIMAVEQHYHFKMHSKDLDNLQCVGELVGTIERNAGEASALASPS